MPDYLNIALPEQIENLQLPDPCLTMWWKNVLENRTLFIDTEITTDLIEYSKLILDFNRQDKNVPIEQRKPIYIWVYSYGGELEIAYQFISVCTLSKTPIITINAGVAMSAGLLILLAGHKRYALPRSRALIHSGSTSGLAGTYEETQAAMDDYKKLIDMMREFILQRTNIDAKLFNKKKSKDWYLSESDQVNFGVVDEIVSDLDILL